MDRQYIMLDGRRAIHHCQLPFCGNAMNSEKKPAGMSGEIRIGGRNIVPGLIITLAIAVFLLIVIRFVLL